MDDEPPSKFLAGSITTAWALRPETLSLPRSRFAEHHGYPVFKFMS